MSRRHIAYAVLVVASLVVSACSQPLAPSAETRTCQDGTVIIVGNGVLCPEDGG